MDPYDTLADIIRSRRTTLRVREDAEIPADVVEELCELGSWAPAHKRTWPWRFAAFTGDARARLGEAFVADMLAVGIGDEVKHAKTLTKYLRTPNILVVGCAANEHPTFHAENRDAVAAAIQNILLAATARGLASFWSTPPVIDGPTVLSLCEFAPDVRIIGVIYLGYAANEPVDDPGRPPVTVRHLDT